MDKSNLEIPTARVFQPLLKSARFKGAHAGRGSGKSHFFVEMLVEECIMKPKGCVFRGDNSRPGVAIGTATIISCDIT